MARPPAPIKRSEVDAIKAAAEEWRRWRAIDDQRAAPAGLEAVTRLKSAAKAMASAIAPYSTAGRDAVLLLATMQELRGFTAPQTRYREMIDGMAETLQLIDAACEALGGRGGRHDPRTVRWVCLAANAWVTAGNPMPTAGGRFLRALDEVELDRRLGIPRVTRERATEALAIWRKDRPITSV